MHHIFITSMFDHRQQYQYNDYDVSIQQTQQHISSLKYNQRG